MTDSKDIHGDERVETLLSQLKNIFGIISTPEKLPAPPSKAPARPHDAKPAAPVTLPAAPLSSEETSKAASLPATSKPAEKSLESWVPSPSIGDPASIIYTAIFYPPNRIVEARTLAQKLECITPKFVKAAFRVNVQSMTIYDPRSDWKDFILQQIQPGQTRALFMLVERPLEEAKRKALSDDLEPKGIYFEQAPMGSIEKKAFYTDVLLGMVFFYDAHKTDKPPS